MRYALFISILLLSACEFGSSDASCKPDNSEGQSGTCEDGKPGEQGAKGDAGKTGPAGKQGAKGNVGPQGPIGPIGPQGAKGETGATGPQGSQGLPGLQGASCFGGVDQDGVLITCGTEKFLIKNGKDGLNGKDGTNGKDGAPGLQGPKGDIGLTGLPGATGKQGPQGIQGIPGKVGEQGFQGNPGPKGDTGMQGEQGFTGKNGLDGKDGAQGPKGDKGDKGDTGSEGKPPAKACPDGTNKIVIAKKLRYCWKDLKIGVYSKGNDFYMTSWLECFTACANEGLEISSFEGMLLGCISDPKFYDTENPIQLIVHWLKSNPPQQQSDFMEGWIPTLIGKEYGKNPVYNCTFCDVAFGKCKNFQYKQPSFWIAKLADAFKMQSVSCRCGIKP